MSYLTSDAPGCVDARLHSQGKLRGSPTWLMRMETRRRRAPGQIMEDGMGMPHTALRLVGMGQ